MSGLTYVWASGQEYTCSEGHYFVAAKGARRCLHHGCKGALTAIGAGSRGPYKQRKSA